MKTFFPKKTDAILTHDWYIIDAKDLILGRLAVKIADYLRGKHKPLFSPHLDTGDFVIVINAKEIAVTGKKMEEKMYYRHSGYMGNMKQMNLKNLLEKNPESVIELAVAGMLPKNKLKAEYLKKLKVYAGNEHPHAAQKPQSLTL